MNVFFRGISFVWALAALAFLAVVFGVRAWLAYRRLTGEAEAEWDYRVSENMQDLRLDKAGFVRAYRRANAPRLPLYMAIGAVSLLALTPIVFALINVGLWGLWKATGESRVFEPGYLVWQFSIFFALIASWTILVTNVARKYHGNMPGLMRDELMYERAGFMPTNALTVGANPVQIKARTDNREAYQSMFSNILGLDCEYDDAPDKDGYTRDVYGDGSGMKIHVHCAQTGGEFSAKSHPFFFVKKHAKEDTEPERFSVIMLIENAHDTFERIAKLDLSMQKITGSATSRMRSFSHENLDVFLYDKRG